MTKLQTAIAISEALRSYGAIDNACVLLASGDEAHAAALCLYTFPNLADKNYPAKVLITMSYCQLMRVFSALDMPEFARSCEERTMECLDDSGRI